MQLNKPNRNPYETEPVYCKQDPNDATLIFESRFESGNLAFASKVSDNFYQLVL